MSKIEVNTVDVQCGSTLTLGSSGKTVTLATGASQSGFGRTGTVDWCTTAKTSPFTAVSGDGFFVNTTSGAITVTLPASPSAGDIVALKDYANTWDTNAVTLCRNGSKINGSCNNATLDTESQSVTLIYVDGTKGWQDIHDSTSDVTGATFISATGGTETTDGNFKIHTFTADGCFSVSSVGNAAGGGDKVSYMVVAGGGGANTGAGGAGGFREGKDTPKDSYTASPLAAACSGLTITNTTFPITVGAGGAASSNNGSNSVFSTITSAGGGGAGGPNPNNPSSSGAAGGSGGGGTQGAALPAPLRPASGGAGNTPPVSPPQGNPGGSAFGIDLTGAGGGGGAGAAGGNATGGPSPNSSGIGGTGGNGVGTSIHPNSPSPVGTPGPDGSLRYFAGGGGGSHYSPDAPATPISGGVGGGGDGGIWNGSSNIAGGTGGTANTGGGAGGKTGPCAQAGGSGIVIIRYKFQQVNYDKYN